MEETREPTVDELKYELQKRDLKVQALVEDIAKTRNDNADLRVEVTILTSQNEQMQKFIQEQQQEANDVSEEPLADDTTK